MTQPLANDGTEPRVVAVKVLVDVENGAWLSTALDRVLRKRRPDRRDAAAATRLAYATARNMRLCDALVTPHIRRRPDRMDPGVRALLRIGACELAVLGTPAHAAVHAGVAAARRVGATRAAGLVNAVLRRVAEGPLPDELTDDPATRWSQQDWVVDVLQRRCGATVAREVLETFNADPPVALRVDVGTPEDLASELVSEGVDAAVVSLRCPDGRPVPSVAVRAAGDPSKLSCVIEGRAVVQDPSSTLAGMLLQPRLGERVVDLAAGPGGKTLQLAYDGADVLAVEPVRSRARSVADRVKRRLAVDQPASVGVVVADGRRAPVADGTADAVLLDAPCSGLGTLGRRPDLRTRVSPEDVAALSALQRELLAAAARLVRPGGRICYAVCTFTPDETDAVVDSVCSTGAVDRVGRPVEIWPAPHRYMNAFWAQLLRRAD